MYIGPWQELRAMQRARAIEEYQSVNSQQVEKELERLRNAIHVVTNQLEPTVASKVREVLASEVRQEEESMPIASEESQSRASTPIHNHTRRRPRGNSSTTSSSTPIQIHRRRRPRGASELSDSWSRPSTPSQASSSVFTEDLRRRRPPKITERQERLKNEFWRWGQNQNDNKKKTTKRPPRRPRGTSDPTTVVSKMKQTYLAGVAEQEKVVTVVTKEANSSHVQPPKIVNPTPEAGSTQKVIEHFDLTSDQLDAVAKYFGGGEEISATTKMPQSPKAPLTCTKLPLSPHRHTSLLSLSPKHLSQQRVVLGAPSSPLDAVDDLLQWAENLNSSVCGGSTPAFKGRQ